MLAVDVDCCLYNCGCLHFCDFRIRNRKTAPAMTHHRVKFMQSGNNALKLIQINMHILSQLCNIIRACRQEFMQRRIEITDGYRQSVHCLINALKVTTLHRQQLGKCFSSLSFGFGYDHFAHSLDAVTLKEHMLGTHQTDSLSPEGYCLCCILRCVSIRSDLQRTNLIRPFHKAFKITGNLCRNRFDFTSVNITC